VKLFYFFLRNTGSVYETTFRLQSKQAVLSLDFLNVYGSFLGTTTLSYSSAMNFMNVTHFCG